MWLPAFKFIKGLFAFRGSFTFENGSDFEGPYVETSTGEYYTGSTLNSKSKKILSVEDHGDELDFEGMPEILKAENPIPTPPDYKKGFFIRYFLEDTRNKNVIEVEANTYRKKGTELYIKQAQVKWVLDKPVKDLFNQGYLYKGAASRNREAIMSSSQSMPKLRELIKDYGKFADIESDVAGYKFIDLPVKQQKRLIQLQSPVSQQEPLVKDISNFLGKEFKLKKLKENLYTSGNRYKRKNSSVEYKGFYHIHPTYGAMVGAVHTSVTHDYLEPFTNRSNTSSNTTNSTYNGNSGNIGGSGNINTENIADSDFENNNVY